MFNYTRIGSFYPASRFAPGIQATPGRYSGRKKSYYIIKRGFDILISLALVVLLLSWLVPFIALIIKLDSGGALFFRQKRVGKDGRYFTCLKFRTMRTNDEADSKQATENDPRITRAGKW